MRKSPELIRRLIELAEADRPAVFILNDGAKAENLDEALRIIAGTEKESPPRSPER